MRLVGFGAALLLVLTACGPDQRVGGSRTPAPAETASTATPDVSPAATAGPGPGPATASTDGSFVIALRTIDGKAAPGIPVAIGGSRSELATSDARGEVRIDGPAGTYSFAITRGCAATLKIVQDYTARFGIAAGQTGRAEVVARFVQRYAPSGPVASSLGPYWPPNETVTMVFTIVDRCNAEPVPAPGRAYPTWAVRTGTNMTITRQPRFRADDRGRDELTFRCTRTGTASIVFFDRVIPNDTFDLVGAENGFGRKPSCRQPPG